MTWRPTKLLFLAPGDGVGRKLQNIVDVFCPFLKIEVVRADGVSSVTTFAKVAGMNADPARLFHT